MEVRNLTGHEVVVIGDDGRKEVVPNVQERVKVASRARTIDYVMVGEIRVPILELSEQALISLPTIGGGDLFVVSGIVAAYGRRADLVVPSRQVRDSRGRVVGCRAFARPRLVE